MSTAAESRPRATCRILSLDGGGAKGFYTLGVLKQVEALVGGPLCEHFDLIFGTSTGAIIAALLGLGRSVENVHQMYQQHVPSIMKAFWPKNKTAALVATAEQVFGDATFGEMKTRVGIVATRWLMETPMIFKARVDQTFGRQATFTPGSGVTVAKAVQASCSAYPFFKTTTVSTPDGSVELFDGGYCANNPTLYAIADAVKALRYDLRDIRVLSVGVGEYPEPKNMRSRTKNWWFLAPLLQKTLNVNTQSMDQLREILFDDIQTVRVNDRYTEPHMATDLMESDLKKLTILYQRGSASFGKHEKDIKRLFDLSDEPQAPTGRPS